MIRRTLPLVGGCSEPDPAPPPAGPATAPLNSVSGSATHIYLGGDDSTLLELSWPAE